MKERMNELIDIINEADYNYHTLDNPTITDQEYDNYLRELFEIEEEHPEWIREDSPTQHAGGKIIDGFEKVTHKIPMMSLSDVFSESELISFDERIKKDGINPEYMCELKIDDLGEKSITNLLDAIESSKNNLLERLLFGLGIPHVGSKTAKLLAMHYEILDNLIETPVEELTNIPDIGEIL